MHKSGGMHADLDLSIAPVIYEEDWDSLRWPNFSFKEIACTHCGICRIRVDVMDDLQKMRYFINKPLRVTSGYRCPEHPIEAAKPAGSFRPHVIGRAFDILCDSKFAFEIMFWATARNFSGIGVYQSPGEQNPRIHIDKCPGADSYRPRLYSA